MAWKKFQAFFFMGKVHKELMQFDQEVLREYSALIGCDEVGRGPIAGPVVGCAVKIEKAHQALLSSLSELKVTDSKKITEKKRKLILKNLGIDNSSIQLGIAQRIEYLGNEFSFCIFEHTHHEIDQINILQASLSAMKHASQALMQDNAKVLIDGNKVFEGSGVVEAVIKGDAKVLAIGLASIIAKNFRDEKMKQLDKQYPGYNLAKHAGYPTKEHKDAVKRLGPSAIHRKSFKGVKEYC